MSEKINKYLSSVGLKFPENEKELIAFNNTFKDYEYSLNEESIDPYKLLCDEKDQCLVKEKVTNVDYHKRTVLAAEIVYQLKDDNYLGHLKLQKLIFLCQNITSMSLHTNFLHQTMGPYDPILMRSIDSQFKKRQWFEFKENDFPKYKPLDKCGEHKEWFSRYFKNDSEQINKIIERFRSLKTDQVELVSTIYACWQKEIESNSEVNNELLIHDVYAWHESKKKFSEDNIIKAIEWMSEKGIYPSES